MDRNIQEHENVTVEKPPKAPGEIKTIDILLGCVSPLLCNEWLPKHSALAFGHLLKLLERWPVEYQHVILLMMITLLQHTHMDVTQPTYVCNRFLVGQKHSMLGGTQCT